ncbi:MAG: hypothetical protein VW964_09985 [Ilumatobacter sp.]
MVDSGDAARAEESGTIALPIDDCPGFLRRRARGLTRRCPWCGDRKAYFTGWFARVDRCRRCRHPYRRGDEAFELGATTANIILTFLSILIAILVAVILTLPDIPTVPVVVIVGAIAVAGPAVWYPISFTLWQAVDLFMRRPDAEEMAGRRDGTL